MYIFLTSGVDIESVIKDSVIRTLITMGIIVALWNIIRLIQTRKHKKGHIAQAIGLVLGIITMIIGLFLLSKISPISLTDIHIETRMTEDGREITVSKDSFKYVGLLSKTPITIHDGPSTLIVRKNSDDKWVLIELRLNYSTAEKLGYKIK